jgi:aminoglycoside phosphotransferase (APT) family kinase protein
VLTATGAGVPDVAGRVRARLGELHPGADVGELAVLPGGRSGLTYSVRAGSRAFVVKAVPTAERPVGRNDVLRQAEVLRALAGTGIPVPEVVASSAEHPAWFAMTLVPGDSVEPVLDEHDLPAGVVRARMLAIAAVLRRLHDLPLDRLALPAQPALDPAGELDRWRRTLRAVPAELRPRGEDLLSLLAAGVPDGVPPVLTHGDLRLGNALCVGREVAAVIDWEIWAAGDPRIDLAWFLLFADPAGFPGVGRPAAGLPGEAELVAAYAGVVDGDAAPPDLRWFRALARLKMAAIMGHNIRRHREGRHHDPVQERLPPTVAAMLRAGVALLS